jgi:uncharacterized Zn finger protein
VPREAVSEKALRYLHERRIRVTRVEHGRVYARARGERVDDLSAKRNGRAWCTCPARSRCAHLAALELVAGALGVSTRGHAGGTSRRPASSPPHDQTAHRLLRRALHS